MAFLKTRGPLLFLLLLGIHCYFVYAGPELPRVVTKLLLVPSLMVYLYAASAKTRMRRLLPVFAALFFSFLGDLFLTQAGTLFFLLGMVSFIVTHICNSIFFIRLQRLDPSRPLPVLLALVIIGTAIFFVFSLMKDNLGAFKAPILVYMGIIGCMGLLAVNLVNNPIVRPVAARYIIPGAAFFILSDAILALDKFHFHQPATWSAPVMATYGVAQVLLSVGAKRVSNIEH